MVEALDATLSIKEIKEAIKSFKPLKTPGLNGIHPMFSSEILGSVNDSTIAFYTNTFESNTMDQTMNTTLLSLITKFSNACIMKNNRPIVLCNTLC